MKDVRYYSPVKLFGGEHQLTDVIKESKPCGNRGLLIQFSDMGTHR